MKFVEGDEFRIDVESVGFENSTRKLKDVVDYSFLAFDSPEGLTMMLQVVSTMLLSLLLLLSSSSLLLLSFRHILANR